MALEKRIRRQSLVSPEDTFIGLANYQRLLSDSQFWNAWVHTWNLRLHRHSWKH